MKGNLSDLIGKFLIAKVIRQILKVKLISIYFKFSIFFAKRANCKIDCFCFSKRTRPFMDYYFSDTARGHFLLLYNFSRLYFFGANNF